MDLLPNLRYDQLINQSRNRSVTTSRTLPEEAVSVPITLQFPPSGPLGNVGFAYSPALEATLSLRVVLDPKRYPARRTRDL